MNWRSTGGDAATIWGRGRVVAASRSLLRCHYGMMRRRGSFILRAHPGAPEPAWHVPDSRGVGERHNNEARGYRLLEGTRSNGFACGCVLAASRSAEAVRLRTRCRAGATMQGRGEVPVRSSQGDKYCSIARNSNEKTCKLVAVNAIKHMPPGDRGQDARKPVPNARRY